MIFISLWNLVDWQSINWINRLKINFTVKVSKINQLILREGGDLDPQSKNSVWEWFCG